MGSETGVSGRVVDPRGYILLRVGKDHHLADVRGYAYEHRIEAERKIGRPLGNGEIVHHINHDPGDNRPENLEIVGTIAEHRFRHRKVGSIRRAPGEANPNIACACGCGARFSKFDSSGRPRRFVFGHSLKPPSRSSANVREH